MAYLGLESIRRGHTWEAIQDIFTLHFPSATTVLDLTFGAGRFWRWPHTLQITSMDLDPPVPVDLIADYRHLPFKPASFDVLAFDPPWLFTRGIRAHIGTGQNYMGLTAHEHKHHPAFPRNPADLQEHYRQVFAQANIARMGLICKGQDLITSTRRDYWSVNTINLANEMGLGDPTDVLIQHSPASRMRDPRWKTQHNFRTAHTTYLIWKWKK